MVVQSVFKFFILNIYNSMDKVCDNMVKSLLLVGVGGQYNPCFKILSQRLCKGRYDVKMSEIHGMSHKRR